MKPVITARCPKCKELVAGQAIEGDPAHLGQFMLGHVRDDLAVTKREVVIGSGCKCDVSGKPATGP